MFTKTNDFSLIKNETMQVLIGVGLLASAAQIAIPLQPVPITLQTMAVMLIGLFYSQKAALKTVLSYLAVGASGVPVFAHATGGMHILFGPTGGYLVGFLVAAVAMATAREYIRKETYLTMLCSALTGTFAIYLLGVSWLALFVGSSHAFELGCTPFIIPECIKATVLIFAVRSLKSA
jgi:biotin transport system substrate-specific component